MQLLEAEMESKPCLSESAETEGFETSHVVLKRQANQGSTSSWASCTIMGAQQTVGKEHNKDI